MPRPPSTAAVADPDAPGEFLDLVHTVMRSIRRETGTALGDLGTTPGRLQFLRTLARCGGARRPGEIAEILDIAPRSVTSKVDEAEAAGHVRRVPDPTDRRATIVELTDAGRALLAEVGARRHAEAQERLGRLTDDERAELIGLLRKVVGDEPAHLAPHGPGHAHRLG